VKLLRQEQHIFHLFDSSTHGTFTHTVGQPNLKIGSVFTPVDQDHQKLVFPTRFWHI